MSVFISYRRDDSPGHAGRLRDAFRAELGPEQVFMDLDSIPSGVRFAELIDEAVRACDVVLVLIGPEWLTAHGSDGQRRLDDPGDWVRSEVEAGLHSATPLIPVLVAGASMPNGEQLPEAIRELAQYNAAEVSERRWDYDVAQLLGDVKRISQTQGLSARSDDLNVGAPQPHDPRPTVERARLSGALRRPRTLMLGVALIVIVGIAAFIVAGSGGHNSGRVFAAPGVPVTFTYPSNWSAPHLNASGYRQVELDPYNGIFVAPAASNLKLKGTYAVANLTQSLESHGGVSMKLVNYDVPNNGNLHQQNYVFTSHGSTWEISCYSQPAFRRYIKSACLKAIGSVKVSP